MTAMNFYNYFIDKMEEGQFKRELFIKYKMKLKS